jgi:hypothetical protein
MTAQEIQDLEVRKIEARAAAKHSYVTLNKVSVDTVSSNEKLKMNVGIGVFLVFVFLFLRFIINKIKK